MRRLLVRDVTSRQPSIEVLDTPQANKAIVDKLRKLKPGALIGIEGFCSAGKSHLADTLGAEVHANVIHTDVFAAKFDQPPPYVDCLDIPRLTLALKERDKAKHCIVEGICLRDTLATCSVNADFYLYVKRIGQNGLWYDALHLEEFENGAALDGDDLEPHRSDLSYHSRVRPHELADAFVERIED